MGLYLAGQQSLDRFGGRGEPGLTDALEVARNLTSYLTYCGASLVVLPERLSDRQGRRGLRGQADENATGPDQLDLVLRLLRRQGYSAWLELNLDGRTALPGPAAAGLGRGPSPGARPGRPPGPRRRPGLSSASSRGPPGHEAPGRGGAGRREATAALSGLLIQLGPGPTLLGTPDTGMDDDTFARFVHDTFGPETVEGIPGLGNDRPEPLRRAVEVPLRSRPDALADLALSSDRQPLCRACGDGAEGLPRRIAGPDHSGASRRCRGSRGATRGPGRAGSQPGVAERGTGSPEPGPPAASAPIVLRGVELSTDPLAHDLATSPDLDARLVGQPHRGMFLTIDPETADLSTGPGFASVPAGEERRRCRVPGSDPGRGKPRRLGTARRRP